MKRISFKNSGGLNLTQAVLSGRKTMTRREVANKIERAATEYARGKRESIRAKFEYILKHSPYKIGDIVAIQQAYKEVYRELFGDAITQNISKRTAGWENKMFVSASLMPHHIRITDVRVERLRDILDEDCLREGIITKLEFFVRDEPIYSYTFRGCNSWYNTPSDAFTALIDKVSGRGTWNGNPFVWAYSFELVD